MNTENKQLLKKYLFGLCTPQELEQVKLLLEQPEADEILHQLMTEMPGYEEAPVSDEAGLTDKVANWKRQVQDRIIKNEQYSLSGKKRRWQSLPKFWRYAAVWAGILMVSSVTYWQINKSNEQRQIAMVSQVNKKGGPVKYLLPDGSQVYLGAASSLQYPVNFAGNRREVILKGEAFFDVKHDAAKPFLIHSADVTTQVLGTSFKVEAFGGRNVAVAVATGKVGVSATKAGKSRTLAMLTPGLKVTYDRQTGQAKESKEDIYSLQQWAAGKMIFAQEPLADVAQTLERRYSIHISFRDKETAAYHVSGTFSPNESASSILQLLGAIGKFSFNTKDNQSFTIYKTE